MNKIISNSYKIHYYVKNNRVVYTIINKCLIFRFNI